MTFVSSLSRFIPSRKGAPILVALAATLLLSACEDKHIGRRCDLGLPPGAMVTDPTVATVYDQALECPSRICILPAMLRGAGSTGNPLATPPVAPDGPFCTDGCESDDDCAGGEKRGPGNPFGCQQGFVCRKILSQNSKQLPCKPICVCQDFLSSSEVATLPQGCM
jgi:hypothetical protein